MIILSINLSERKQRVIIGKAVSEWAKIDSGVPQGSVLGPGLFIIYVNDLMDGLKCQLEMYADDSKLFKEIKSVSDSVFVQDDLNYISQWTRDWKLYLNCKKCKLMQFGAKVPRYEYKIKDLITESSFSVKLSPEERDLGIIIKDDLKWDSQVNAATRANRMLGLLSRTFSNRSVDLIRKLFCSFIRPHLEFASSAWNPYLQRDISALEKIQRRVKLPTCTRHLPYLERLKIFNLQSLETRRKGRPHSTIPNQKRHSLNRVVLRYE